MVVMVKTGINMVISYDHKNEKMIKPIKINLSKKPKKLSWLFGN